MKRSFAGVAICLMLCGMASAAALGTAANAVIPKEVQQIISVDYRRLEQSPTALALKDRVLPDNLKTFETALRSVGVNPDTDVDQFTFASFRTPKSGLRIVGIAAGQFARAKVQKRMKTQKIMPTKYEKSLLYGLNGGLEVTFLDDWTMLFGDDGAIKAALDTRDGKNESLNSNGDVVDLIQSVNGGAVWSVLDAKGTQNMMRSSLGDAAALADYDTVKKRLRGSYYTMDFSNGVDFDLRVLTADSMTAATLSSVIKAGMMYKKLNASAVEKTAIDAMNVDSEDGKLKITFKSDDQKFQSLLHSELFTAISR